MQLKLDNMERRMNEMAPQMGHNHKETQSSPPLRTEIEVLGYNKKTFPPIQTEEQKKQEIVADLSVDIKKIKPPKFFSS